MYSDRWKYVSGSSKFGERFLCRSHILALIFVDLWSQVVWSRLWHRYYRKICPNVGKKKRAQNSDIFHHRLQLVYNLQQPILYHNQSDCAYYLSYFIICNRQIDTFTAVKRNLKFQTRYMKGVPFLSKKVYKRVKGWTLKQSLPT